MLLVVLLLASVACAAHDEASAPWPPNACTASLICFFPFLQVDFEDTNNTLTVLINAHDLADNETILEIPEYIYWWTNISVDINKKNSARSSLGQTDYADESVVIMMEVPNHHAHFAFQALKLLTLKRLLREQFPGIDMTNDVFIVNIHPEYQDMTRWNDLLVRPIFQGVWQWQKILPRSWIEPGKVYSNVILLLGERMIPYQNPFFASSEDAALYRTLAYDLYAVKKNGIPRDICLVSRSRTRRFANEQAIVESLMGVAAEHNVTFRHVQDITVSMQPKQAVHFMSRCRHLITPHGSDIIYSIFLRPRSYVTQAFSSRFLMLDFWQLLSQLGLIFRLSYPMTESFETPYSFYACSLSFSREQIKSNCPASFLLPVDVDIPDLLANLAWQLADAGYVLTLADRNLVAETRRHRTK